jgi:hypothetical protein
MLAAVAALFSVSMLPTMGADPKPTPAMMKPIQAALDALNNGNPKLLTGIYASNATVVDEFPPYSWSGATAGADWFNDFGKFAKQVHLTNARGSLLPVKNFNESGGRAYIVVPTNFGGSIKGKPMKETGTWTFTLQRSGSAWMIVTQSWGTVTETM